MDLFPEILPAIDAALDGEAPMPSADTLLEMAEAVIVAWLDARGEAPDGETVEGFRLLALHRQGCKGTPSFNACRETCREIVFRRNVVVLGEAGSSTAARDTRLLAMTVRHLALFVGGKLAEAGLGDFCCSSRPLREAGAA